MSCRRLASLLVVLAILGLVAPRVSAVFASAAPGVQTIVICTGDGLHTIQIGEDGKPVSVSEHSHPCVLCHVADTSVRPEPAPLRFAFEGEVATSAGHLIRSGRLHAPRPPPRAPPLA